MKTKVCLTVLIITIVFASCENKSAKNDDQKSREFNSSYSGDYLNRVAFPIGGIGAGMFCLEGTGAISHISLRHQPDVFNERFMFAAIAVKGFENGTKVLEGPIPKWKIFGNSNTGNGAGNYSYGFPRFEKADFKARFPFGLIKLVDKDIPLDVNIKAWSPFIPCDADNSSLPVGALEYTFKNTSDKTIEASFSFHSENIMRIKIPNEWDSDYEKGHSIKEINNGFLLKQDCLPEKPHYKGDFAVYTDEKDAIVDLCWFRGGWFDSRTMLWKDIQNFTFQEDTTTQGSSGASIFVAFKLHPNQEKTIRLMFSWNVPHSNLRVGWGPEDEQEKKEFELACKANSGCCPEGLDKYYYEPWYSSKFKDINEIVNYFRLNYKDLFTKSELFSETFYASTLPDEVLEAVSANLTILKSPTVLRQKDGKLWAWEGCHDASGCCYGSCTHVWNYAQAISRLFPGLERSLRETEYRVSQNMEGHQHFRSNLPIREAGHGWHAAADGQLGGMMKVYREWRTSGNTEWLKSLWPSVKQSMDYCIQKWDPKGKGILEEPHHNTYDIEFWGPNGMCTSFYLGALTACVKMGEELGQDVSQYKQLFEKGKKYMENELYNGEYFIQKIVWEGLEADDPVKASAGQWNSNYSEEASLLLQQEGPKYQYGNGCLSDGVLGCWIGQMCGLDNFIDQEKIKNHLLSIHKYNLKFDLSDHVNPQRPGYGCGNEGGLLLCTWPKGGQLSLPFVYSNEVWTGIEYQVASHLMLVGETEKGLEIVREVRKRYDGRIRNPFNEYECGHWYARAMASYGLIQGLTGIRYDAVDNILYLESQIGDNFSSFISTETGWGLAGLKKGEPFIDVKYGSIFVKDFLVK